jgi:hypothetical protein
MLNLARIRSHRLRRRNQVVILYLILESIFPVQRKTHHQLQVSQSNDRVQRRYRLEIIPLQVFNQPFRNIPNFRLFRVRLEIPVKANNLAPDSLILVYRAYLVRRLLQDLLVNLPRPVSLDFQVNIAALDFQINSKRIFKALLHTHLDSRVINSLLKQDILVRNNRSKLVFKQLGKVLPLD